jgi:F-type H+-transporting ATPase subunit gamma
MSKLSALKGRIHTLGEIKSILSAMKNLSIIEMNKISRFLESQQKTAAAVEEAMGDFGNFYGNPQAARATSAGILCVLVGSERGFCGAFNETVLMALREAAPEAEQVRLLAVGRKLALKLEGDPRLVGVLAGPNTAEEIPGVIDELFGKLAGYSDWKWTIFSNEGSDSALKPSILVPFEHLPLPQGPYPFPPLIQLPPSELYSHLLEQYLFFLLYRVFYFSFMAENRRRFQHMEGAIQALEKDWNHLMLRFNGLRQEEITEELEIILLNAGVG